ncbi:unnamed protein product [Rhizoctonia solani]|uniref:HAT C-terminal dimerisation domain-containing protein n=1 Tax=Rhizoctonia solani TaxID=456999 RepID=A0A8H3BAT4_9AGAM|nr:unnamed protein product [Rhizoctonia solani]
MDEIKNSLGEVSLTTDLWSDELLRAFMAVTAHYINSEGNLAEHLIAFRKLDGHHTGANVGQVLFSVIDEMGIVPKMGMVTADNASSNDTMMDELKRAFDSQGIDFDPEAIRLRNTVKGFRSSAIRREGFKRNLIEGNQAGRFKLNGKTVILPVIQPSLDCPTRWGSTADMIDNVRLLYLGPILDYSIRHTDLDIPCISHKQFLALQNVSTVLSVPRRVQQLLSAEHTPTLSLVLPLYNNLIGIWRTCITKFPEQRHAISVAIDKIQEYIIKTRRSPAYAFAMFVNPHIKMSWIDSAWSSSPDETTSLAEHALDAIKSRLLMYAEERDRKLLERCTRIQSTHANRADRAAVSQQNGYAELLLLGETIGRAPDHPLSSLVTGIDSPASNSGLNLPDYSTSFPPPAYLPDHDPHTVSSSNLDHESRQLSYAAVVSRLSPEQLRAKHLAQVEEEIAIWLGIGPLPLKTNPKDPLKKDNVNMVDFWKGYGELLPLIHRMAVDVLPAQASSVSSERVFSSSKLTCTRERNRISAELVEARQVLKHSVRQQRSSELSSSLLDFTDRITPIGDDVVEWITSFMYSI